MGPGCMCGMGEHAHIPAWAARLYAVLEAMVTRKVTVHDLISNPEDK